MSDFFNLDDAFDKLHSLADLQYEDRKKHYTQENVSYLCVLAADLLPDQSIPEIDDSEAFSRFVQHLDEEEAFWSRRIGKALLEASECKGRGDIVEAVSILDEFITSCPSTSYREIALIEKANYQEG